MQCVWRPCGLPASPYFYRNPDSLGLQWVCDDCARAAKIFGQAISLEEALVAEVMLA